MGIKQKSSNIVKYKKKKKRVKQNQHPPKNNGNPL